MDKSRRRQTKLETTPLKTQQIWTCTGVLKDSPLKKSREKTDHCKILLTLQKETKNKQGKETAGYCWSTSEVLQMLAEYTSKFSTCFNCYQ